MHSVAITLRIFNLDDAEEAMLELYCVRAEIKDGQTILDIGCVYTLHKRTTSAGLLG